MKHLTNISRALLALTISGIMLSCANNTTEPVTQTNMANPSGHYILDVKTSFSEKASFIGAKSGLIAYIGKTTWAEVEEYGETYSVWIKGATRTKTNNTVRITFELLLNTPSNFTNGDVIKGRNMDLTYSINQSWTSDKGLPKTADVMTVLQKFMKDYKNSSLGKLADRLTYGFSDDILSIASKYMTVDETADQKAEAVIIGGECFAQVQQWLLEIEATK